MGNLTFFGLVLDIAGVCFLSVALALVNDERIKVRAGTYWGFNQSVVRELSLTRVDARIGLALLVIGFTSQIFGYFGMSVPETGEIVFWGILISVLAGLIAGRKVWGGLIAEPIILDLTKASKGESEQDPSLC